MKKKRSSLPVIEIPDPCGVPWEQMQGDARVRFCATCNAHVHDISRLTPEEAMAVVERGSCVNFEVDASGSPVFAEERRSSFTLREAAGVARNVALVAMLAACHQDDGASKAAPSPHAAVSPLAPTQPPSTDMTAPAPGNDAPRSGAEASAKEEECEDDSDRHPTGGTKRMHVRSETRPPTGRRLGGKPRVPSSPKKIDF